MKLRPLLLVLALALTVLFVLLKSVAPIVPVKEVRPASTASQPVVTNLVAAPLAQPATPDQANATTTATIYSAFTASPPKPAAAPEPTAPPATNELAPATLPAETVMENMRSVFRQYAARLGGNPVGTNPEITAALTGQNPKQIQFLNPEDGLRINSKGELVDAWGTPFFFHQLSAKEMEIHSAGPDRAMWTDDDLVIK
jgi:hypothetical protein